jgi:cyclopropane-fatty-acyl-phospholipid synthase
MIEALVDSGLVPEPLLRAGIRAVCALRLREQRGADQQRFIAQLRASDIAIAIDAANTQHYEVPAAFFERVLGPQLKYSACYCPRGVDTQASS